LHTPPKKKAGEAKKAHVFHARGRIETANFTVTAAQAHDGGRGGHGGSSLSPGLGLRVNHLKSVCVDMTSAGVCRRSRVGALEKGHHGHVDGDDGMTKYSRCLRKLVGMVMVSRTATAAGVVDGHSHGHGHGQELRAEIESCRKAQRRKAQRHRPQPAV
jgi:hypothetical protein